MTRATIDVGDRRRTFVHVAPSRLAQEAPLLLALHGTTQQGATLRRFSGRTLDVLAERIGADLVYLDGFHRAWNDARRVATSRAQRERIDDVGFVRAVVQRFGRPTIAIGYSNGGQLVHRLLHEAPGLLVGAVSVAAGLPAPEDSTIDGVAPDPVPLLLLHGTADPVVPYAGGPTMMLGRSRGVVQGARATAEYYAAVAASSSRVDGALERVDWPGLRLVTQRGAGHVVPNRRTRPAPLFVGPSLRDLDTGEEVAEFFGLHPRDR